MIIPVDTEYVKCPRTVLSQSVFLSQDKNIRWSIKPDLVQICFKLIDGIRPPPSPNHPNTYTSKLNLPLVLYSIVHIHLAILLVLSYLLFTIEQLVFYTLLHSIIMFQNVSISCFNHKFSPNNEISTIIPQFSFKYQQHTSVCLHV